MKTKLPFDFGKNKNQTIALIGAVALITAVVYLNFILKPQVTGVAREIIEKNKLTRELKGAQGDVGRIGSLRKDIESHNKKIERYEKILPAEQEIPTLLENLSDMARASNVKIVGITPSITKSENTQSNKTYEEIPILISAKSGYHELGNFLAKLENSDRFMKVVDIKIRSSAATPKRHDVDLLVLTYILLKGK